MERIFIFNNGHRLVDNDVLRECEDIMLALVEENLDDVATCTNHTWYHTDILDEEVGMNNKFTTCKMEGVSSKFIFSNLKYLISYKTEVVQL